MKSPRISKHYFIYFIIILLFTISSCKNKETSETATATEAISTDSTSVTVDTVTDTAAIESPIPETTFPQSTDTVTQKDNSGIEITFGTKENDSTEIDPKMGKVAFYCENENMKEDMMFEMKEDRTYEMRAMLNPLIENDEIKSELLKVINESRVENRQKPLSEKDITSRDINLGYYLSIQIKDPGNKFNIDLVSSDKESYTKKIFNDATHKYSDTLFEWKWNVTPKPNSKGKSKLELVIVPLDKNKKIISEKIKTYNVNINFKQNFILSVWDEMNRNVKWAIAAIIAPILAFLISKLTKKKE